jgi:hypothetical protein
MALTMVAPMGIIMLATMRGMYRTQGLNAALYVGLAVLFVAAFAATRQQTAIADRQFVSSMIPHHSGAILICREANLKDPELVKLCEQFSKAQRSEIEQMNAAFPAPESILSQNVFVTPRVISRLFAKSVAARVGASVPEPLDFAADAYSVVLRDSE